MGESVEQVSVSGQQLREAGFTLKGDGEFFGRTLLKQGNRDFLGSDFVWVIDEQLEGIKYPFDALVVERLEWGNLYGYLRTVIGDGGVVADVNVDPGNTWALFQQQIARSVAIREDIHQLERVEIGRINHALERLRLQERKYELDKALSPKVQEQLASDRSALDTQYRAN
jgi:phosphate transport system permease protein